jgi:hypothetical protein
MQPWDITTSPRDNVTILKSPTKPLQHHKTNQAIFAIISLLAFLTLILCLLSTYKAYKTTNQTAATTSSAVLTPNNITLPGTSVAQVQPPHLYDWNQPYFTTATQDSLKLLYFIQLGFSQNEVDTFKSNSILIYLIQKEKAFQRTN